MEKNPVDDINIYINDSIVFDTYPVEFLLVSACTILAIIIKRNILGADRSTLFAESFRTWQHNGSSLANLFYRW